MRIMIFFLVCQMPQLMVGEVIQKPVVNVYLQPEEDTEVDSQAIYGSKVEVIESLTGWSKIKMIDGVEGWVLSSQLASNDIYENSDQLRPTKSLFTHIYRVADTIPKPPLVTLPYGSMIKLDRVIDTGDRWVSLQLVSGEKAWVQRGDVEFTPRIKTLEEVLTFSQEFLGLPYTWGGASSYGFDCSAFVQMLFKEMGILLPRNSRDQARCDLFVPVAREDLQRGDLVFFGIERITHVGIYLGEDTFIHSGAPGRPMIAISHLQNTAYVFSTARRIDPSEIEAYRL